MKKEHMAEFLEEANDLLGSLYVGWLLQSADQPNFNERCQAVQDFIVWAKQDNRENITAARLGGSYEDVRESR